MTNEPFTRETSTPPTIALKIPAIGGKPDAIAIPKLNGRAIKKTRKPEIRSFCQYFFKPAIPVSGILFKLESFKENLLSYFWIHTKVTSLILLFKVESNLG